MIVKGNGNIINTIGGGTIEKSIIKDTLKVIKKEEPAVVEYSLENKTKGEKSFQML